MQMVIIDLDTIKPNSFKKRELTADGISGTTI